MRAPGPVARLLVCWTLLAPGAAYAAPSASDVKAVYLFNFATFVEWPAAAFASDAAPFAICVVGPDPFGHVLDDTLAGEKVGGRPLVARRLAHASDASGCQIVFVVADSRQNAEVLQTVAGRPVLTVGDGDVGQGEAMVTFVMERGTVRFRVNAAAATRSGLVLSSHLLRLAHAAHESE